MIHVTAFVIDVDASIRRSRKRSLRSSGLAVADFASASEFFHRPRHRARAAR
jgi:FixJ family two-component response regulator